MDSNRTLLKDYQERLSETEKAKNDAWKAYTEGIIKCGFRDDVDYHEALKTESEIRALKKSIDEYTREVLAVEQDLKRFREETKGKEEQDLEGLKAIQKELRRPKSGGKIHPGSGDPTETNKSILTALEKAITKAISYQKEYLLLGKLSRTANGELAGKQKLAFEQYVQASYLTEYSSNPRA